MKNKNYIGADLVLHNGILEAPNCNRKYEGNFFNICVDRKEDDYFVGLGFFINKILSSPHAKLLSSFYWFAANNYVGGSTCSKCQSI